MSAFTWPPESPAGASADPAPSAEQTQAAVLVAMFLLDGQPQLVLTKRRADLRRHAGEISFPGGRQDDEDADLAETALREAEEEIGLPRAHVSMLGTLAPTSTFATGYVIHPYVATIPAGLAWRLSAREVEEVLELPLQAIADAATKTQLQRRGITFQTDAYVLDGHVIWGATARIIELLLERLEPGAPGQPPALRAPDGDA